MTTRSCSASSNASYWSKGCLVVFFATFICFSKAASAASVPPCSLQRLQSDCKLSAETGAVAFSGALPSSRSLGPPAISGTTADLSGVTSLQLSYVILHGFRLPDPASSHGLVPSGQLSTAGKGGPASSSLQDVRILVDLPTLQQHGAFFKQQQGVTTYTDDRTFLHVNYYASGSVVWKSVGLLLADSLEDARSTSGLESLEPLDSSDASSSKRSTSSSSSLRGRFLRAVAPAASPAAVPSSSKQLQPSKYNYVLTADQDSIVQHLQQLGPVEGPVPALIYLNGNVTLSKPPVPAGGIVVARPMFLVGLAGETVGMDFHMQVNQVLLTHRWSNFTFDSMAVENLAPGDAKSAELARPLSVSSANNFWPLYYNRTQDRLKLKNVTCVLGSQVELDYYMFWATVYHSKLPYFKAQANFLFDTIGIYEWKVGWQTDTSIQVIKCYSQACRVEDCTFQLQPVVAPRMAPPAAQLGPDLKLRPAERSALVTAVGTPQTLKEQLWPLFGPEAGRSHVVLLRNNISLHTLFNSTAAGSNDSSSDGNASTSDSTSAAYVPPGVPASGIPVSSPLSVVGDLSRDADADYANTVLDLAFARGLLSIGSSSGNSKSQLQLQHLWLQGLAQGPAAASARGLESPDVWTLLGWAFRRSGADDVVLSGCTLELPPEEYERLARLAETGFGQVVLKISSDMRGPAGDGLLVLTGVDSIDPRTSGSSARRLLDLFSSSGSRSSSRARRLLQQSSSSSNRALWVETLSAQGLSGSRLLLVPSEAATASPQGYFWPGGDAPTATASGLSPSALAAALTVPIVVVAALLAVAAFVVLARHKKRKSQQEGLPDRLKDMQQQQSIPGSSSSSFGSAQMQPDSKGMCPAASTSRCCSIDEGQPYRDQSLIGSAGVPAELGSDGLGSACQATTSTIDSAHSMSDLVLTGKQPRSNSPNTSLQQQQRQQQQPSGLSHRLTSAISNLQQDITRRRIVGPFGPGSSQQQHAAALSPTSASATASEEVPAGQRHSTEITTPAAGSQQQIQQGHPQQQPACNLGGSVGSVDKSELQVLGLIGRGSFASVFRAIWRGRCVALKVVQLPVCAGDGDDDLSVALQTRERMAVMEAVISATMSHPNVVQVYTFALQPVLQGSGEQQHQEGMRPRDMHQPEGSHHGDIGGWELHLLMEYCEEGSLRSALNQQRLVDPSSPYRLPAVHLVLALAHDVACAMLHLHSEQVVHSDLKAGNVLLTKANTQAPFTASHSDSAGSRAVQRPDSCATLLAAAQAAAGGRLVAKVADFGLSLSLDPGSTHISHMHAGTLTHMAPELLLHGHASKASDVYAFGILLWEMVTGLRAFQGMPVALVGHQVTQLGLRPPWVPGVPLPLKQLVEECWAQDPRDRPAFSNILSRLEQMLQHTPLELHEESQDQSPAGSQPSHAGTQQGRNSLEKGRSSLEKGRSSLEQQQREQTQPQTQPHLTLQQQMQQAEAQGIVMPGAPVCAEAAGQQPKKDAEEVTGDWTM